MYGIKMQSCFNISKTLPTSEKKSLRAQMIFMFVIPAAKMSRTEQKLESVRLLHPDPGFHRDDEREVSEYLQKRLINPA